MSVKLFNLFVSAFKKNLPKYPKSVSGFSVNRIRFVTAMEVATDKKEDETVSSKNLTRYKKRFMKRQWDDQKKQEGETEEKKEKVERIKRKKMAMLLGYCGVDYYGMQRNPGVRTIEEDLMKALFDAKYITEEDFNNQQNAQFQRSSRTDKGVSAARQVVSLKLPLEINIEEINKRLPECIKVFGVKRVTNKFNSKVKCNARTYSYTLPTYVFEPTLETEEQRKYYRISEEKLKQINEILAVYKGTKSYHNFTEKKHYQDPSASRYMMGFSIEKVFVERDMEFAVLLVKGQSFMLHQIRKMVGLAIAIVRGHTEKSIIDKAFGKDKVIIPTAPGLGLVLDTVHYDRYDSKFKNSHASLTWEEEEEAVQKFRHQYIFPNIVKGEVEGNSMGEWINNKLVFHSYEPSDDVTEEKVDGEDEDLGGDDDDDDDEMTPASKVGEAVIKKAERNDKSVKNEGESNMDDVEEKPVSKVDDETVIKKAERNDKSVSETELKSDKGSNMDDVEEKPISKVGEAVIKKAERNDKSVSKRGLKNDEGKSNMDDVEEKPVSKVDDEAVIKAQGND